MPQLENGYVRIADELLEALMKIRISGEARQVFDAIMRKTYGWQKKWDTISLSQFEEMTGISRSHIIRARKKLLDMNLIIAKKGNDSNVSYSIQKNYKEWKPLPKKATLREGTTITMKDIKEKIRKRDGYKCFICNKEQGIKLLPVHHIDYNQGNNDDSNLITLCTTCHARTNSNYDYWKELLSKKIMEYLLPKKEMLIAKKGNEGVPKKAIDITQKGNGGVPKKGHTKDTNTKDTTKDTITKDKGLSKPTKRKIKKPTNPNVKIFLDDFFNTFKAKTGAPYLIVGKDGALIKRLLGTYSLEELQKLKDLFFNSTDEFIVKAGYSVGIFFSQINKIVSGQSGRYSGIEEWTREMEEKVKEEEEDGR